MKQIKLTIAVPVYNVSKYLERCLESIIRNSIKGSEILLVNDGSTDNSGEICDKYAQKYKNIRVIHQTNKGLAEVRNVCIQNALGEYISFIDSDDYILDNTYIHLMNLIDKYKADILCYGVIDLYENVVENIEEINDCSEIITELTAQEALEEMLLPKHVDVITCNKIIKRSLYSNVYYPSGKLFEDMFTNYKVISKASKIISTNFKYYCYYHREGSIGRSKYNPRSMDLSYAVEEVYDFGMSFCGNKIDNLIVGKLFWNIVVVNFMIKSDALDFNFIKSVQKFGRKNFVIIINNNYINITRKLQMILFSYWFNLYSIIYKKFIKEKR